MSLDILPTQEQLRWQWALEWATAPCILCKTVNRSSFLRNRNSTHTQTETRTHTHTHTRTHTHTHLTIDELDSVNHQKLLNSSTHALNFGKCTRMGHVLIPRSIRHARDYLWPKSKNPRLSQSIHHPSHYIVTYTYSPSSYLRNETVNSGNGWRN